MNHKDSILHLENSSSVTKLTVTGTGLNLRHVRNPDSPAAPASLSLKSLVSRVATVPWGTVRECTWGEPPGPAGRPPANFCCALLAASLSLPPSPPTPRNHPKSKNSKKSESLYKCWVVGLAPPKGERPPHRNQSHGNDGITEQSPEWDATSEVGCKLQPESIYYIYKVRLQRGSRPVMWVGTSRCPNGHNLTLPRPRAQFLHNGHNLVLPGTISS
jgi:hypothetical protein